MREGVDSIIWSGGKEFVEEEEGCGRRRGSGGEIEMKIESMADGWTDVSEGEKVGEEKYVKEGELEQGFGVEGKEIGVEKKRK